MVAGIETTLNKNDADPRHEPGEMVTGGGNPVIDVRDITKVYKMGDKFSVP